jgi:hypothetical protein
MCAAPGVCNGVSGIANLNFQRSGGGGAGVWGCEGLTYADCDASTLGNNFYGVYGKSTQGVGVYAYSTGGAGVWGSSTVYDGVHGETSYVGFHAGVSGTYKSFAGNGVGVYGNTGSTQGYGIYADGVSGSIAAYVHGNLQVTGTPFCNGCTSFTNNNSDARLKKNIQPLTGALDRLLQLHGVTFEWKEPAEHGNHEGLQRGFIAQDVEKVIPEWVGVDGKGFKTLNLSGWEPMAVESIRTLKLQNDELRDRVKALEAQRRPRIAGFSDGAAGMICLSILAGATIMSRRKRTTTAA